MSQFHLRSEANCSSLGRELKRIVQQRTRFLCPLLWTRRVVRDDGEDAEHFDKRVSFVNLWNARELDGAL
jgi:hypothetical protein